VRYWSLLFLAMAVACTGVFVYAALAPGFWLPRSAGTIGRQVDYLFLIILGITGAVFVVTQLALAYVTWTGATRPGKTARYFHGSQWLEFVWTLIPAGILIFLALYQMGTWADIKDPALMPEGPPSAEITGRQFQWLIRYPGPDGKLGTIDDLHATNDLRMVRGVPTKFLLRSEDVIHSFFLPQIRIKQDAVPGLDIPIWFDVDRAGRYEIVCTELCGWGHYKMRAVLTVYDTEAELDAYLASLAASQAADHGPSQSVERPEAGGPTAP
jgi:cytochrome c oxidase subunit 2